MPPVAEAMAKAGWTASVNSSVLGVAAARVRDLEHGGLARLQQGASRWALEVAGEQEAALAVAEAEHQGVGFLRLVEGDGLPWER
jgi:hypothetical protein